MSAVPKKKLCWHCDGSIATDINNCPYCGVYLLATDDAENKRWSPSDQEDEEAPAPLYQLQEEETAKTQTETKATPFLSIELIQNLKVDIGPILMLMAGSIFFLFGIVLFLFSQDGILTLQWNGSNWIYFLGLSVPLIFLGWKLVKDIE